MVTCTNLGRVAFASASPHSAPPPNQQVSPSSSSEAIQTPDSQDSNLVKMADAANVISQGCLRQITEETLTIAQPIVQCVQIKPMNSQQGAERYRVVMSDTINFMQGMLAQSGC